MQPSPSESVTRTLSYPQDLPSEHSTVELTFLQENHFEGGCKRFLIPSESFPRYHLQIINVLYAYICKVLDNLIKLYMDTEYIFHNSQFILIFPEGIIFNKALPNVLGRKCRALPKMAKMVASIGISPTLILPMYFFLCYSIPT